MREQTIHIPKAERITPPIIRRAVHSANPRNLPSINVVLIKGSMCIRYTPNVVGAKKPIKRTVIVFSLISLKKRNRKTDDNTINGEM